MRVTTTLLSLLIFGLGAQNAIAYEVCNDQNNYLEALLPDPADEVMGILPQICVEASQLSLSPVGYYGFCPTADGAPVRGSHVRPCISQKYVSRVHSSLMNVTECLGVDPRLAFATFNLESALHIGAVGAALDVGIGQLTKSAIDEVTLNALDRARKMAAKSPNPACQKVLPYMTAHSSDKANRCGYMSVPENPMRNLVYSVLLIEQNRKVIERMWTKLGIVLPEHVDAEHLKMKLVKLAYNAGPGGPVVTLKAYADQMGPRMSERLFHFENRDMNSFVSYIQKHFPVGVGKESSRKRISKYVFYVAQAARRVEKLSGAACIDPLMFPLLEPAPTPFVGPAPDAKRAEALIAENLAILADGEISEMKSKSCEDKQREFLFNFLPRGMTAQDLPETLLVRYKALCK